MYKKIFLISVLGLLPCLSAAALDEVTVLALSPLDGRAVVKYQHKMQVLTIGDRVPGSQAQLKQVLQDKIVVQEKTDAKGKTDTVWIFKADSAGGASRLQRLSQTPPPNAPTRVPVQNKTATDGH